MAPDSLPQDPSNDAQSLPEELTGAEVAPAYVPYEQELARLIDTQGALTQEINTFCESLDEDAQTRFDEANEEFQEALDKGGSAASAAGIFEKKNLPDELVSLVRASDENEVSIEEAKAKLEEFAPIKAQEVVAITREFLDRVDYAKLAHMLADPKTVNLDAQFSIMIGLPLAVERGQITSWNDLKYAEGQIQHLVSDWQDKGLLREPDAEPQRSDEHSNEGIREVTALARELNSKLPVARELKYRYQTHALVARDEASDAPFRAHRIIEKMTSFDSQDEIDLGKLWQYQARFVTPELRTAVVKEALTLLHESLAVSETDLESETYLKIAETAREMDAKEAVDAIAFSGGFEALPFPSSVELIKTALVENIPPFALSEIKSFAFRALTEEERNSDITLGFCEWSKELGGFEIVIDVEQFANLYQQKLESYDKDPDISDPHDLALFTVHDRFLSTVLHEAAHVVHEMAPLPALKVWEEARTMDEATHVTPYVKYRFDTNHHHKYMEDFADSLAKFCRNPEELYAISSERYAGLVQMYKDFMPNYKGVMGPKQLTRLLSTLAILQAEGKSVADYRRELLYFEDEDKLQWRIVKV